MKPSFVSCPSLCQITYLCPLHCDYWGRQIKTKQADVSPLTTVFCNLLFRAHFSAQNWHIAAGLISIYLCVAVAWSFLQGRNSDNNSYITKSLAAAPSHVRQVKSRGGCVNRNEHVSQPVYRALRRGITGSYFLDFPALSLKTNMTHKQKAFLIHVRELRTGMFNFYIWS